MLRQHLREHDLKNLFWAGIASFGMCLSTAAFAGELTVANAIKIARNQNVVVVGEIHDNPIHHFVQREFSAGIKPDAIVFEMIQEGDEAKLNALRKANTPREEIETALDWEKSGWPPFPHYAQIMDASPNAVIYGAALPRERVRRAVKEGAASVFGDQAGLFGLDKPLPRDEQIRREARQMEAHCDMLPPEMLPGMIEAQRLRDASLAAAVLRAQREVGGKILVIAGNGHADLIQGMPFALSLASPGETVFSFAQLESAPDETPPFDAYHVTLPAERKPPCEAFSKS